MQKEKSRGGQDPSKFTTTNLKYHLQTDHPAEYQNFKELQIKKDEEKKKKTPATNMPN